MCATQSSLFESGALRGKKHAILRGAIEKIEHASVFKTALAVYGFLDYVRYSTELAREHRYSSKLSPACASLQPIFLLQPEGVPNIIEA